MDKATSSDIVGMVPKCDMESRALVLFRESCKTDATKKSFLQKMGCFLRWANKDYESILLLPTDQLNILLEDYVLYLKKRIRPSSVYSNLLAVYLFLETNDRVVNKKKLSKLMPARIKPCGQEAITTKQINEMLKAEPSKRARAVIHILSATGARPEAIGQLKIKHLGEMPDSCLSIIFYADSLNEHVSFTHSEARDALNEYFEERKQNGELLKPESYVIAKRRLLVGNEKLESLSVNAIDRIVAQSMNRIRLRARTENSNRYELAVCTCFRKRFNTILKKNSNISYAVAEMLMDHKVKLESYYFKPTKEELFEEYKKAIPDLILDSSYKLKAELEAKNELIKNQESEKDAIISDFSKRLSDVEKILNSGKN